MTPKSRTHFNIILALALSPTNLLKYLENSKSSLGACCIGFVHEHTRPDRDNFITLNEENIEEGSEGNFRKRVLGDRDFFEKDSVNTRNSPYDVLSLLHYGPQDFSKNGEGVFTFIRDLPDDQTWPEPDPEDPLSIVDEVELSLAYQCNVSQESLLKYIHFNRHHNTLLIEHTVKMVKENRRLIDDNIIKQSATTTTAITTTTALPALPVECKNYNVLDSRARHFQTTSQTLCKDM